LPSNFGDVLAHLATSTAMDKWMFRLNSAGQKGPEITLEGILIVVEECFTAERNGSGLSNSHCTWLLPFYTYLANCLVSYLLSSMVFTATVFC